MIQLFVPSFRVEECLEEIRECLEKGWTGLGFKTVQFEEDWKAYTGLEHAHFLNSNTVGLEAALSLFVMHDGWDDGDEVITTPLTFVSSNHAILHAGLQPVFADVDDTLCLDPASVRDRITDRTKAVMYVGMGGSTGSYDEIREICREHGLRLILDAAHMAGTRLGGRHVGHDADVTVFSFQAVKNLPTADSGMICFREAELDDAVRKYAWLGINKDTYARTESKGSYKWMYDVEYVGRKIHGNSVVAAIGLVQLKYLDLDNAYRRQLANWYRSELTTAPGVELVALSPKCESAQHLFQIRVGNRDELLVHLNGHDVYPGVHYRDNTEYHMYKYAAGTCPNANAASREIISLPMHMGVTRQDVSTICELVRSHTASA